MHFAKDSARTPAPAVENPAYLRGEDPAFLGDTGRAFGAACNADPACHHGACGEDSRNGIAGYRDQVKAYTPEDKLAHLWILSEVEDLNLRGVLVGPEGVETPIRFEG
jgi:hypothetical protein